MNSTSSHHSGPAAAAIDIGGTKVLVALVQSGRIIGEAAFATRTFEEPDALVAHAGVAAAELAQVHEVTIGCGVVAVPGLIDRSSGVVRTAANIDFRDYPLAERLGRSLGGVPFEIEDDANAGALGETYYGAAKGYLDVLYITISTGIGLGILVGGRPVVGARGAAGELGHVEMVPGGHRCGCGRRGCFEAYASGLAIAKRGTEVLEQGGHPLLAAAVVDSLHVSAKEVIQAAENGDSASNEIMRDVIGYVVRGARLLQLVLDPEVMVFGGGVMSSSFFAEVLITTMREREGSIDARRADLPDRSVILGCVHLVDELSARMKGVR